MKVQDIVILGCGTDVGKTLVAAIFSSGWKGIYWKPVHCGTCSDTRTVKALVEGVKVFPEAYCFKEHGSAHYASKLEGITIDENKLSLPKSDSPLIVESSGGVLHPLRKDLLQLDLIAKWKLPAILVSHHYIGSINHTLLTIEAMQKRGVPILGIVFNGNPYPEAEEVILERANAPKIGHLFPEKEFTPETVNKYVKAWKLN